MYTFMSFLLTDIFLTFPFFSPKIPLQSFFFTAPRFIIVLQHVLNCLVLLGFGLLCQSYVGQISIVHRPTDRLFLCPQDVFFFSLSSCHFLPPPFFLYISFQDDDLGYLSKSTMMDFRTFPFHYLQPMSGLLSFISCTSLSTYFFFLNVISFVI